ncbi:transcription factor [Aspergillus vadensis CBS 113365]|uniref:Fungal-specific transcription factor n=1 Tax=Aspergillus vadensis (strain CBS 113365 / IMI 142717 / IBT 24658) TaxID=1448311 RepID=A0A319B4Y4_ASPVC|nr:fungal-specific transcription factor [Aspergillus vadensis CBS 113365]PYH66941.1 fungal-specific transcription factor [Aspergillus vadensis CBS 113365]
MPALRRKNGREPACEACRRRKLACDHETPACQRCRRLALKCVYLANPLAKGRARSLPEVESPTALCNEKDGPPSTKTCPGAQSTTPILESSAEYLGPTSFASVFVQHRDRFEVDQELRMPTSEGINGVEVQSSTQPGNPTITPRMLQLGIQILQNLPDEQTCNLLFVHPMALMDACFRPAYRIASDKMWDEYRNVLRLRNSEHLQYVAQRFSECSLTPLPAEQNPHRWIESFSGKRARWELLGSLFTIWSSAASQLPVQHEIITQYCRQHAFKGPKELMVHFKRCAFMCIELCSQLGAINILFVNLAFKHNILESIASGDKSLSCWRQHGDVIAVTTSIGLHRELSSDWNEVSFQHELKRRVYASIYNFDKVISTFTGRPPLLNRKYSTTQLPLDINDEDIFSDRIGNAVAKLNSNGWDGSVERQPYPATILRARAMLARNREEMLEVLETCQDSITDAAVQSCLQLKGQATDIYAQFPEVLKFKTEDVHDRDIPGQLLALRVLVRLDFLLNLFILERLLTRHRVVDEQALIQVSHEMVGLTLIYWKHKDRFENHVDFSWLAMSYAVPGSGILCLELLRQSSSPETYTLDLPRSDIIQNLSVLVAFLDWLRPSESDIAAKAQIKGILQRSLDRILSMPASLHSPTTALDALPEFVGADPHLDLLNTFAWVDWDAAL